MARKKSRPAGQSSAFQDSFGLWAAPLVGILLVLPACGYTFAGDDHDCIGWNEDTDSSSAKASWWGLFLHDTTGVNITNNLSSKEYRPLSVLSWRLDHFLAGDHLPFLFHSTNALMHGLSVLLFHVFLSTVLKVPDPIASASSVVFAAHPTHLHAATNVAGRPELLFAIFQFAGMLVWNSATELRAHSPYSSHIWRHLLLFLLLVVAGTLAHELCAVTVPLASLGQLLLTEKPERSYEHGDDDVAQSAKKRKRAQQSRLHVGISACLWHALSFAALAGGLTLRQWVVGVRSTDARPSFVDNQFLGLTGLPRLLSALNILALQLWYLFSPFNIHGDYSYSALPVVDSCISSTGLIAVATPLVLLWLAFSLWRSGDRRMLFCLLWLLLQLFLLSGALFDMPSALKPRSLFVPSAAACAIASLLVSRTRWTDSGTKRVALLTLAAVFAATTLAQNSLYESHFLLWRTIRNQNTMNAKAHYKLGNILAAGSDLSVEPVLRAQVMELYVAALKIYPSYDAVYVDRGKLYMDLGEEVQAEDDFQFAADLHNPEAHFQLGLLYMTKAGKPACMDSEWHFLQGLKKDPTDYRSYTNLGICRYWTNDMVNATLWLDKALIIAPPEDLGVPCDAKANILRVNKEYDAALSYHRQAVAHNPDHLAFRANLAYTLYEVGRYLEAAAEYDEVAARHPEHFNAYKANADLSRQMLMTTINLGNVKPIHPP